MTFEFNENWEFCRNLNDFYKVLEKYLGYELMCWVEFEIQNDISEQIEYLTREYETSLNKYSYLCNDLIDELRNLKLEISKSRLNRKKISNSILEMEKLINSVH